jgi:hypothetical protein
MSREFLRIYQEFDFEEVKAHLLILGDLTADCAACRMLGIDGYNAKYCPECRNEFRYMTSRRLENHPEERFPLVRRMREKRPDLIFIDYTDFQKTLGRKKARDFFA